MAPLPAQWSRTIGYTHNVIFSLFRTGSAVSDGVRMFVEKGDSNSRGRNGFLKYTNGKKLVKTNLSTK